MVLGLRFLDLTEFGDCVRPCVRMEVQSRLLRSDPRMMVVM